MDTEKRTRCMALILKTEPLQLCGQTNVSMLLRRHTQILTLSTDVSMILPLDDHTKLGEFFEGFATIKA